MNKIYKRIKGYSLFLVVILMLTSTTNLAFALKDESIVNKVVSIEKGLKDIQQDYITNDNKTSIKEELEYQEKNEEERIENSNVENKIVESEIDKFSEKIEKNIKKNYSTNSNEESVEVNNEKDLINAIENEDIKNITIVSDINLTKTIVIDRELNIRGVEKEGGNIELIIENGRHLYIDKESISHSSVSLNQPIELIIKNIDFKVKEGLSKDKERGGIEANYFTNLKLIDCNFENNIAKNGGAIYIEEGTLELDSCSLSKNNAFHGSAIYSKVPVLIKDSRFINNSLINPMLEKWGSIDILHMDSSEIIEEYQSEIFLDTFNGNSIIENSKFYNDSIAIRELIADSELKITGSLFDYSIDNEESKEVCMQDSGYSYKCVEDLKPFIWILNGNNSILNHNLNIIINDNNFTNNLETSKEIFIIVGMIESNINIDIEDSTFENIRSIITKIPYSFCSENIYDDYFQRISGKKDNYKNISLYMKSSSFISDYNISLLNIFKYNNCSIDEYVSMYIDKSIINSEKDLGLYEVKFIYGDNKKEPNSYIDLYFSNNIIDAENIHLRTNTYEEDKNIIYEFENEDDSVSILGDSVDEIKDLFLIHNTIKSDEFFELVKINSLNNPLIKNNIIINRSDNTLEDNKNELFNKLNKENFYLLDSDMSDFLEIERNKFSNIKEYYKPISKDLLFTNDYLDFNKLEEDIRIGLNIDMVGNNRNIYDKLTYGAVEHMDLKSNTNNNNYNNELNDIRPDRTSDKNVWVNPSNNKKVYFYGNGGRIDSQNIKIAYLNNNKILNKIIIPKREGYRFVGWSKQKDRKDFFDFSKPIDRDINLYAIWEKDFNKLDRINHFSYIQGYPDRSVRPENNITREEVSAVFYRLLTEDYKESIYSLENNFTDLSSKRWSNKHISTLAKADILTGYEDGEFKYASFITRAEVATIASRFENLDESDHNFTDVKGHWAEEYIASASKKGWVEGYKDGTFKPDEYITRAEFVTLVNRVLNRGVKKENILEGIKEFKDLKDNTWYYEEFVEAINGHTFNRDNEKDRTSEKWLELKEFNMDM